MSVRITDPRVGWAVVATEGSLPAEVQTALRSHRFVVFGGTGFVGRSVMELLRRHGCTDSVSLGRDVDIRDYGRVAAVLLQGDVVVNAAGYAAATERRASAVALMAGINVDGAANIARAAASVGAAKLIHISSVAAQGPVHGRGLLETDSLPPQSPYARSKLESERVVAMRSGDSPLVVLRPTSVFGPHRGLTRQLMRLVRFPVLPLPRRGRVLVPLCHVDNVAHAVLLSAAPSRSSSDPITVADTTSTLLCDALTALASSALNTRPRFTPLPDVGLRFGASVINAMAAMTNRPPLFDEARIRMLTRDIEFDVSRAARLLGYEPVVSTIDGLAAVASTPQASH